MIDRHDILEETLAVVEEYGQVSCRESANIAIEIYTDRLTSALRTKRLHYSETNHNQIAVLVIDNLLKELNNA